MGAPTLPVVKRLAIGAATLVAVAAGCGSGGRHAAPTTTATQSATTVATATTTPAGSTGPGALQAEAAGAAAGDIPDNQVFLTFRDSLAGYSMRYPEGWAQRGSGKQVTFRDKNNIVRIVIGAGPAPRAASVRANTARLTGATVQGAPARMTISGRPAYKVVYSTESTPNPVTGKRVKLVVDRYYLWMGGRTGVVDLGTPVGVDNVDAYRLMIESFRWS